MDKLDKIRCSGWGRNTWSYSKIVSAANTSEVMEKIGRGVIPAGLGRSYGDSALNSNGYRIDTSALKHIERIGETNIFRCGAGLTIGELSRFSLARGFYPYVVPGTEFVTIGGAVAGDIHGKSHHKVGSFSKFLKRIVLLLSDGNYLEVFPVGVTERLFNSTAGGLGLTGLIVEADIELMPVKCSMINVTETRAQDLDEMLEILKAGDSDYLYSVAWIDLSGKYLGRGRVTFGNHCIEQHSTKRNESEMDWQKPRKSISLTPIFGFNLVTPIFVRLFNLFWFLKPLKRSKSSVYKFMHPLDGVSNWNVLYGKSGFVQYQFVVPHDQIEFLKSTLAKLSKWKIASPLGVLKQLGQESSAFLGFAKPGWTLAVDIPVKVKNLASLLNELDRDLVAVGGRVYLVKDSRMMGDLLSQMYPSLEKWRDTKREYDKSNFWQSDQSRRLEL
jgi:decaprenylphospho-beta-D-ribofuranose 2-oxidase